MRPDVGFAAAYPPLGGQFCGSFANTQAMAAPACGRLTVGPGAVDGERNSRAPQDPRAR